MALRYLYPVTSVATLPYQPTFLSLVQGPLHDVSRRPLLSSPANPTFLLFVKGPLRDVS